MMNNPASSSADRLAGFDFTRHNEEVRKIWAALDSRQTPHRIPIILGTNTRYFMFNRDANPGGLDFRAYSDNPDVMFDTQLQFQRWSRFNLLQDYELGLPDAWTVSVDFQNYSEAAWFGCGVHYFQNEVPDTMPDFADAPERVMEKGMPDPFSGILQKALEYWEHFKQRAGSESFLGRPIKVLPPGPATWTDGPMTVACNLFGADFVCENMAGEPERLQPLLEFITESLIRRIAAWRKLAGLPVPQDNFGYADDSLAMISTDMYCEHILPLHRRIFDAFASPAPRNIHLCGDSTRHFHTLRDELNIQSFDTGFPVDFGSLRRDLGPKARIQGGPHVQFLMRAKPGEVREEVRRILQTGVLEGGQFVLREGNNLAPGTPLENTEAMYHAGREFGKLAG